MKHGRLLALILTLAVAAVATVVSAAAPVHGVSVPVTIVRAIDGDTIEVEIKTTVRVRLLDCWCKESRTSDPIEKAMGVKAKEAMQVAVAERPSATLFVPTKDIKGLLDVTTMGRVLGKVWVDGFDEDLSAMMVRIGHASTTKGGKLGE